ncbi:allophanate hydrolase subunit 1 [Nocardioides sp.]|uniref:5-oxoprolinase subunit B family protein n=1 Tax=Nocardioides sp. TaxID=35761 RepID=UPI0035166ED9
MSGADAAPVRPGPVSWSRYGDRALRIRVPDADHALACARIVAERGRPLVDDVVPGARTVLVLARPGVDLAAVQQLVPGVGELEAAVAASSTAAEIEVVVPTVYDGPDLAEVAALTGLSEDDVVAAHTGRPWRVAFVGFAPGFGYLTGGDPRLQVPRRAEPRTRVPAGSVALAGEYAGVYPRASPGGWRLLGRTDLVLFDLDRDPAALLTPGTLVRFEAV